MSSPTSPEPRLPVELAEQVIDCLRDDPASLLACIAVCQSWLPRARYHLYRTIALTFDRITPTSRAFRFLQTLQANPSLVALVEKLQLAPELYPDLSHVLAAKLGPHPSTAGDWPTTLGPSLGRLHNVRALRLSRADFEALADLLALPRLFPRLSRLSLGRVRVRQDAPRGGDALLHRLQLTLGPQLRALTIRGAQNRFFFDEMLRGFRPGGVFSRLEVLVLDEMCSERDTRLAWMRVPALLRATLRELLVNTSRWAPMSVAGEDQIREECTVLVDSLRTCAALRSLTIQLHSQDPLGALLIRRADQDRFPGGAFRILAERLASSAEPLRELRHLTLVVRGWPVSMAQRGLGEHLACLAETLLDRARFPSFERVAVRLSWWHSSKISEANISSAAELAAWRRWTCAVPPSDTHRGLVTDA